MKIGCDQADTVEADVQCAVIGISDQREIVAGDIHFSNCDNFPVRLQGKSGEFFLTTTESYTAATRVEMKSRISICATKMGRSKT